MKWLMSCIAVFHVIYLKTFFIKKRKYYCHAPKIEHLPHTIITAMSQTYQGHCASLPSIQLIGSHQCYAEVHTLVPIHKPHPA